MTGRMSDELPNIPGTLIEATLEHQGKEGRRYLIRSPYFPAPWMSHQDVCDRAYWNDADLRDVKVLFVPAVSS